MTGYDIVRGFAPDHTTIDIEHEAIPGFMPSMTMPFTVREAREIAGAIVFLVSPLASAITGVVLPVDGGWTAR
jgi:NAD(P)-dependent dehydrogenase (short-subunit alcohol dehydrogenase family)